MKNCAPCDIAVRGVTGDAARAVDSGSAGAHRHALPSTHTHTHTHTHSAAPSRAHAQTMWLTTANMSLRVLQHATRPSLCQGWHVAVSMQLSGSTRPRPLGRQQSLRHCRPEQAPVGIGLDRLWWAGGRHLRKAVHRLLQRVRVAVKVVVGVLRRGVRVRVAPMLGL